MEGTAQRAAASQVFLCCVSYMFSFITLLCFQCLFSKFVMQRKHPSKGDTVRHPLYTGSEEKGGTYDPL